MWHSVYGMQAARKLGRSLQLRGCKNSHFPSLCPLRALTCKALVYETTGRPSNVVKLVTDYPVPECGPEDVTVNMLMCPINPADVNIIQGVYALKPPLPAVGGGEGVGVVTEVGAEVTALKEGDLVIPSSTGLGTWRTTLVTGARDWLKVSGSVPLEMAATMAVNPPTAYGMLKRFAALKPGDCVIQNGSNSGVGQSVIQLAAAWGVTTINIIRNRGGLETLRASLRDLGAAEVVTESESAMFGDFMADIFKVHGRPVLGFNCVGGKSASNLMKHLAPKSTMVTYGGMSLKPLTVGTGSLIFKDLRLVGYWNSKWLETNAHGEEHLKMMAELCSLAEQGKLRAPNSTVHPLAEGSFQLALDQSMEPYIGAKQLLNMQT